MFDNPFKVEYTDKYGVKVMIMLDFLIYYSKDKFAKIIDEIEGFPLNKEIVVKQECISILEAETAKSTYAPPP